MFKRTLIIIGIVLLLSLAGVWTYLLLFGTPQSFKQIFTNLGEEVEGERPEPSESGPDQLDISEATLEQLTTTPVAGYVVVDNEQSEKLLYAERGTGHIYRIDLNTGLEERVGSKTVAKTIDAVFSDDGNFVILISENGALLRASLHEIGGANDGSTDLPPNSANHTLVAPTTVLYTKVANGETVAYSFDTESLFTKELWRLPMAEVDIFWTTNGPFAVNKASPNLAGGVYTINGTKLTAIVRPRYALSAIVGDNGDFINYTYYDTNLEQKISKLLEVNTDRLSDSALPAIPDKCVFNANLDGLLCAASFALMNSDRDNLNSWYRGEFTSSDTLWLQRLNGDGGAEYIASLSELAGFTIDATDLKVSESGEGVFFINKMNDTLWMYRVQNPEVSN